jgi:hypothetical protein
MGQALDKPGAGRIFGAGGGHEHKRSVADTVDAGQLVHLLALRRLAQARRAKSVRGEGTMSTFTLDAVMDMPEGKVQYWYARGVITQDQMDLWLTARHYLHPVDGRYGHVSIGCDAARCGHIRVRRAGR